MEELERLGKDEAFLNLYDREEYEKALQDEMIDKARSEGLSEGLKEGIEQGVEQKTKEDAINFYKNGASKELICTSLKISLEQLDEYLKEAL